MYALFGSSCFVGSNVILLIIKANIIKNDSEHSGRVPSEIVEWN